MEIKRLLHTVMLWLKPSPYQRANYLRKHRVFKHIGKNVSFMTRIVPLYSGLISIGNNVCIASNIHFVTHDVIHVMLNNIENQYPSYEKHPEHLGCIEIGDNVFVGANTQILYNVKIGSNVIIGAHSLVNKDIPDGYVAAGVPAKVIGKFEDFVNKRKTSQQQYPKELKPHNQTICHELEKILWKEFYQQRK